MNLWGKRFKLPWLTHERFLTIDHSCKIFFWYLTNWTSTSLWFVVLNVTYSTTHQRSVEVQCGRYKKNVLQEWFMVKNLSCVSYGSLKRFPHTFTTLRHINYPWDRVSCCPFVLGRRNFLVPMSLCPRTRAGAKISEKTDLT